jgi:hypothetical protein
MKQGNRIALAAVLACVFTPGLCASTVFSFDSFPMGTVTPFTDTVAGLQASFSDDGDPGGFEVVPTFFKTLTGNVLTDGISDWNFDETLTIAFSAPQTSISMNFALDSVFSDTPFDLSAFNGATAVGSSTATGTIPCCGIDFPEGVISFSGPAFNSVVLSSPAILFSIDNVTVSAVPTVPLTQFAIACSVCRLCRHLC